MSKTKIDKAQVKKERLSFALQRFIKRTVSGIARIWKVVNNGFVQGSPSVRPSESNNMTSSTSSNYSYGSEFGFTVFNPDSQVLKSISEKIKSEMFHGLGTRNRKAAERLILSSKERSTNTSDSSTSTRSSDESDIVVARLNLRPLFLAKPLLEALREELTRFWQASKKDHFVVQPSEREAGMMRGVKRSALARNRDACASDFTIIPRTLLPGGGAIWQLRNAVQSNIEKNMNKNIEITDK